MPTLGWYWHRLKVMTPAEIAFRAHDKLREFSDSFRKWDSIGYELECSNAFPKLPTAKDVPDELRQALQRDREDIHAGRWRAFRHLDLNVDDPPRWHYDYLAGKELGTAAAGFVLDHRRLPEGSDVKLIWELSRWYELVRLAMAAYVMRDDRARCKCIEWLEDWVRHNRPYRGWNWTSALEAGMRLIQFTWIDALLSDPAAALDLDTQKDEGKDSGTAIQQRLKTLRHTILPPHVWYVWRHRSFGTSANNHLLGELAGCILATVRWPALATFGAPLSELQTCWELEVMAQFAEDGGNKEQALNYHLFSFELCWQTVKALEAAGRSVPVVARQRLARAGLFFSEVQVPSDPWDYGDSDGAFVTPFFASDAVQEWRQWLQESPRSAALTYWLGEAPSVTTSVNPGAHTDPDIAGTAGWRVFPETGLVLCETDLWRLRWDVSPLGYLSTAAHGHLDALHLSVWLQGVAVVVDPGTGAYYSDHRLRTWLASRAAHNGPCPEEPEQPRRLGPFLWARQHPVPSFRAAGKARVADLDLWGTRIWRRIVPVDGGRGYHVEDDCISKGNRPAPFRVRWQFAPDSLVEELAARRFSVERAGIGIIVQVGEDWATVRVGEGIVSPAFRKICRAPFLELSARSGGNRPLRTTFLTDSVR
jgi:hypothetical protein